MASIEAGVGRTRVALVGDVGGHRALFESALRESGADPATGHVPTDLLVVQVGDLVHRGPDSVGCVEVADRMLRHGSGRYVQLLGEMAARYLDELARDLKDREFPPEVRQLGRTLRRWRNQIVAWHRSRATNGPAEAVNNLIPVLECSHRREATAFLWSVTVPRSDSKFISMALAGASSV